MNCLIVLTCFGLFCLSAVLGQVSSQLNHLNYYATHAYVKTPAPFSLENIMTSSLEIAMENCQNSFKWDRWNCPNTDFITRSALQSLLFDPEDSYINAITMAAVLYTITKNCSSGIVAGCGACPDNLYSAQCSDDTAAAEQLLKRHVNLDFSDEFYGKMSQHNYKAVTNLLHKSLVKQCGCAVFNSDGLCVKEVCLQVLKPFEDIAAEIRQMYDESVQLCNPSENSRILWDNIPLDALVYLNNSPNYCEPDAVPHWNGMRGRQCSTTTKGEYLTVEELTRCSYLCQECGHTVQQKDIVTESRCNCKFTWDFQVQCETCRTIETQYYCF